MLRPLRSRLVVSLAFASGLMLGALTGCGELPDDGGGGGSAPGKVCYSDSDCVPDGCCGTASGVVQISDAPSCGGVTCTSTCDPSKVNCGCGIPYCRDSRCTVAVTDC